MISERAAAMQRGVMDSARAPFSLPLDPGLQRILRGVIPQSAKPGTDIPLFLSEVGRGITEKNVEIVMGFVQAVHEQLQSAEQAQVLPESLRGQTVTASEIIATLALGGPVEVGSNQPQQAVETAVFELWRDIAAKKQMGEVFFAIGRVPRVLATMEREGLVRMGAGEVRLGNVGRVLTPAA